METGENQGEQAPIQVVDANKEVLEEAAKLLEYQEEPQTSLNQEQETPEEPAPAEKPAEKPKKTKKTAKPAPKKPEPAPAPPEMPPEEPKKSKRELFREAADNEKVYRDRDAKLKEREEQLKAQEQRFQDFMADPISYLEKINPRAYEEWTQRNLQAGTTPENKETMALKKELEELKNLIKGTQEETQKKISHAEYVNFMNEAKNILREEEFGPFHQSISLFEEFTGRPTDIEQAVAGVWAEYNQNYNKSLTPRECCEILLEDANAHLDKLPKSERLKSIFGVEKSVEQPPKPTPKTGRTLTQAQETASAPAPSEEDIDPSQYESMDKFLQAVAEKTLKYQEVEEE